MRTRKLVLNTISSWIYEVLVIISGLILPRMFLSFYGSEINGLVQSITQFLSIISFMQLGMGAVIQASLYKPLVDSNSEKISEVVTSANKFFKKIGIALIVYSIILMFLYPKITNNTFDFQEVVLLVFAISLNLFVQYYFGIVDIILLNADQKGYINYIGSIITLIFNTVICVILIYAGLSIQLVKIISAFILLIKPMYNRVYINKHYSLNRRIKYTGEPIKQKWNGIAQHISNVVIENTDTIVLTLFSTLSNVSIYGVYYMVINGIKTLFLSVSYGVEAVLGEFWARGNKENLYHFFESAEWLIHNLVILFFGCTGTLIVPFIMLYTKGVTDANYNQFNFAVLIVLAHSMYCIRLPYHMMIKASGQFKETQSNYFIAAIINVLISIITVKLMGLIGVAIGTFIAMLYQTVWMAVYNYKNIFKKSIKNFLKLTLIDSLIVILAVIVMNIMPLAANTILKWVISAFIVFIVWAVLIFVINCIFYKDKVSSLIMKVKNKC